MSDSSITFVPIDPRFLPSLASLADAEKLARECFPCADAIVSIRSEKIRFFDCGSNFEAVSCPNCGKGVDLDFWGDLMCQDFENGEFSLAKFTMPCCSRDQTLNDLRYDWPQAFGVFENNGTCRNLEVLVD